MTKTTLTIAALAIATVFLASPAAKADGYSEGGTMVDYPPVPGYYTCHYVVVGGTWYGWNVPTVQDDALAARFMLAQSTNRQIGIWGGGNSNGCGNGISWVEFD